MRLKSIIYFYLQMRRFGTVEHGSSPYPYLTIRIMQDRGLSFQLIFGLNNAQWSSSSVIVFPIDSQYHRSVFASLIPSVQKIKLSALSEIRNLMSIQNFYGWIAALLISHVCTLSYSIKDSKLTKFMSRDLHNALASSK